MLVNGSNSNELNPSQCFSILFRGDWTLDLMILSHKRDEVLDAIDQILETYQSQKRRVSNDVLLLRYHWLDAVSDKVWTLIAFVVVINLSIIILSLHTDAYTHTSILPSFIAYNFFQSFFLKGYSALCYYDGTTKTLGQDELSIKTKRI